MLRLTTVFPEPVTCMLWSPSGILHVVAGDVYTIDTSPGRERTRFTRRRLSHTFSVFSYLAVSSEGCAVGSRHSLVTSRGADSSADIGSAGVDISGVGADISSADISSADIIEHRLLPTALGVRLTSAQGTLLDVATAHDNIIAVYKLFGINQLEFYDAFKGTALVEIDIELPNGNPNGDYCDYSRFCIVFTSPSTFLFACTGCIFAGDMAARTAHIVYADPVIGSCIATHDRGLMAFRARAGKESLIIFARTAESTNERTIKISCGGCVTAAAWSADANFFVTAEEYVLTIWQWEANQIVCKVPLVLTICSVALDPRAPWIVALAHSSCVSYRNVHDAFAAGMIAQSVLFLILSAGKSGGMPSELWHFLFFGAVSDS